MNLCYIYLNIILCAEQLNNLFFFYSFFLFNWQKPFDLLMNRGWKQTLTDFSQSFCCCLKHSLKQSWWFSWTSRASVSSSLRSDSTASAGQVSSCCVWDHSDRFAVTENTRAAQRCGKLSQRSKLFSLGRREESCRPRTAWADVGARAAQTAPVCFWFHRGEQTSSSNQTATGVLAVSPRLLAAVVHTYPRHGLPEEMTPVVFPSPHPFLFNHSSSTSASAYFRLFCRTRFNSACTCWLSSSSSSSSLPPI